MAKANGTGTPSGDQAQQAFSTQPRVIASRVIDPREPSLFVKRKKSDPAEHLTISCQLSECPLLKAGFCAERHMFKRCPYGSSREERGPTRRAANFAKWVREHKDMHPGVGWNLSCPPGKLAFVGEYVYLPYSHMDLWNDGKLFVRATYFTLRSNWTIDTVLSLIDFRPRCWLNTEIATYRTEVVPKFITHIRECDPDMWRQLVAARPHLDTAPNYVGRKALVWTLAHPITIPPKDAKYPVAWEWNGITLRSTGVNAYSETWGGISAASAVVEITPSEKAAVVVADNAWVTPQTVFVD